MSVSFHRSLGARVADVVDAWCDQAASTLETYLEQGVIDRYHLNRNGLEKLLSLLAKQPDDFPEVVTYVIGYGVPDLPGLSIEKAPSEDHAFLMTIRSMSEEVSNWTENWVFSFLRAEMLRRKISGDFDVSAVRGILIRAKSGRSIENYPVPVAPILKTNTQFEVRSDDGIGIVSLIIHDPELVVKRKEMERVLSAANEAGKKFDSRFRSDFFWQRSSMLSQLKEIQKNTRIFKSELPWVFLVGLTGVSGSEKMAAEAKLPSNSMPANYPGKGLLKVIFSKNRLEAVVQQWDSYVYKNASLNLNEEWLRYELSRLRIAYGWEGNFKMILGLLEKKKDLTGMVIATGKEGKPGSGVYIHPIGRNEPPAEEQDVHKIDMRKMRIPEVVENGQLIAEIRHRLPPVAQIDVFGRELLPPSTETARLRFGKGVEVVATEKIYATMTGSVQIRNDRIEVKQLLEIREDINLRTGNVTYTGDVMIHGSIEMGARVVVNGNLIVQGSIVGAKVYVTGSLTVRGTVNTSEKGNLVVFGDADIRVIENSRVTVYGSLEVKESCLNSTLSVSQILRVTGMNSRIAGGVVSVGQRLYAYSVGIDKGASTSLRIGCDAAKEITMEIRDQRCHAVQAQAQKHKASLRQILQKPPEKRTSKHVQQIRKTEEWLKKFERLLPKMKKHVETIKNQISYHRDAYAEIEGVLHKSVILTVMKKKLPITKTLASVMIIAEPSANSHVLSLDAGRKLLRKMGK